MSFKPPAWRRTYEFIKRLTNIERYSPGIVAQSAGVARETVDAWTRPTQSDENPNGSGKNNPSDTIIRFLGMAHEYDPGLSREWAEMFVTYVDFLDEKTGAVESSLCDVAARYLKEHSEMMVKILKNGDTAQIWTELAECEAAFNKLKACLKETMKSEPIVRQFAREKVATR